MKLSAMKIIIASVCLLPFVVLAGGPPTPPDIIKVTILNEESSIMSIIGITVISISVITAIGIIRKWRKKQ